jgi:hypothetical protein
VKESTQCLWVSMLFFLGYAITWFKGNPDDSAIILFAMFTLGHMILKRLEKAAEKEEG